MFPEDERRQPGPPPPSAQADIDALLPSLLRAIAAPEVPESLDRNVLAAFRRRKRPAAFWWRLTTASIRVPLPIVAAAGLLLLAFWWLARLDGARLTPPPQRAGVATFAVVTRTSLEGFVPVQGQNVMVIPAGSMER